MKRKTIIVAAVGAGLSLALAAGFGNAHPYGYGPGSGMGGGPGYGMGFGRGPGYGDPAAAVEGRLAYLKAELKITKAQEGAWKKYSDEARKQAESMQAFRTAMWGSANAADRAELHNKLMKSRVEQSEKTTAAFKQLYAALTPEQKALADRHPGMDLGMGFGGGPGGRFR
jgi:Spy/CpxP family protein refolding chaperone